MQPQRWQKLQELFDAAHALDGEARERLLQEQAGADAELAREVRSLLAAHASIGIMDEVAPRLASVASVLAERVPERIDAYRIVGELGRGGMGVVYHAERDDGQFQQRVAIKLIAATNASDPLHQRFRAERQILAGLVHPHIARLLDGGITEDGRPYLVMEYVDGVPITTYCDRHHLDVRGRLRLFTDVCSAVQHAHQNLVVHRDLKPSNILVSNDGRVHLLDFGIAKLLDPAVTPAGAPKTRHDWGAMTPEYASPEQVRGDALTTASDIYSLGVLLYELLSGQPPYELTNSSPVEIARAVCERDVVPPSVRVRRGTDADAARLRGTSADRLARQLAGDLDGIVLMALRKEPGLRYASADMLRQDIERYLSGLQVIAHRGSTRYRVQKFVRRHRVETTAGTLVLAALITGLSVAIAQSRRAARERDRAEQALAESEGITNFLLELFRTGNPGDTPPTQLSALDLLQRGAQRVNELSGQPAVQARLLDALGQMSLHLGRLDEAQQRLEQAVAIRREALGDTALDLANSMIHLGWVHRTRNDYDRARELVGAALSIRQRTLPPNDPRIGDAYYELGWVDFGPRQEQLYRAALASLPAAAPTAEQRMTVLQALSTNLRRQGRFAEAVAANREALQVAERAFGPEHHATGSARIHLADHVADIEQDYAAAEQLYRRGLTSISAQFGDNSLRLIHGLNSLARLLNERGDPAAEQLFRRALIIRQSASGPEHPNVADQLHRLATAVARQGRAAEAEALARQALDLSLRVLGPHHPVVAHTRLPLLAEVLDQQGRHAAADATYDTALAQAAPEGIMPGEVRRAYGVMLLRRRDFARAEQQLLHSLTLLEQAYRDPEHPNVQESRRALMRLYEQWGKPALVERYRVPPGRFVPY